MNCEAAAKLHYRWEHKQNLPTVIEKKNEVKRQSVRTKRIRDLDGNAVSVPISKAEQKKQRIADEKLTLKTNVLAETATADQYLKNDGA